MNFTWCWLQPDNCYHVRFHCLFDEPPLGCLLHIEHREWTHLHADYLALAVGLAILLVLLRLLCCR